MKPWVRVTIRDWRRTRNLSRRGKVRAKRWCREVSRVIQCESEKELAQCYNNLFLYGTTHPELRA